MRLVMISDTHGRHRRVDVPPGDILIHAGDFTQYGKRDDAVDFNAWLGELPHQHIFVVLGNHEANAPWRKEATALLTNATLLCGEAASIAAPARSVASVEADCTDGAGSTESIVIFGTDFFWPMPKGTNPHYAAIPEGVDILVCHGPVAGHADGGSGCKDLLRHCERTRPRLVVSGHIHSAHGMSEGRGQLKGTTFVNAANARNGHADMGWPPVIVDL